MNTEPIISIIVPVYNVAAYLRRCLDSIRSQTFKQFEVILVNDASTDDSGIICDDYVSLDSRFKVIHKLMNSGVSAARNSALEIAQGRYIGSVDSDDYIHPQMYETLYRMIQREDYDIAICDFIKTEADHLDFEPTDENIQCHELALESYVLGSYWNLYYCLFWNKIYKRSFIEGIKFDNRGYGEDLFFNVQVFKQKPRVICSDFVGVAYFQHCTSVVHTARDEKNIEWMTFPLMTYYDVIGLCESSKAKFALLSRMMLMAVEFNAYQVPKYLLGRKKELIDRYKNEIRPLFLKAETNSRMETLKKYLIGKMLDYPRCARLLMAVYLRVARALTPAPSD